MIQGIEIKTSVDAESGAASLEVLVRTAPEEGQEGAFLWAQLLDEEGAELDRILPAPLEPETAFRLATAKARLWNAEQPCFYTLSLELRDREGRLLGTAAKKLAFYIQEQSRDGLRVNGKLVRLRPFSLPAGILSEEGENTLDGSLASAKRAGYNAVLLPKGLQGEKNLRERCLEYGLYVLDEAEQEAVSEEPDFGLEVTPQGVLIENRCVFTNVLEYDIRCSILREGRILGQEVLQADIPPGRVRYLELSLAPPREAGEYICRAQLCLKRDFAWAKRGEAVAEAECVSTNFFA